MEELQMSMGVKGVIGATTLLVFWQMLRLGRNAPEKIILKQYQEIKGLLREKQKKSEWYQRMERHLRRNGAAYHYGRWINPTGYLTLRMILGMMGLLTLCSVSWGYGMLTAILLFFMPEWLLQYMNKRDNEEMLSEIKLVYHALEIQMKAGVYVTDALAECYSSVKQKRLQQALLDLAGRIVMKADIYEALENFQENFDNRYIDSLCITLLQACESGQAVELLKDIGEQIKDMELAILNSRKSTLDRSVTFYQLGILIAVLGVIVYACVNYLFTAALRL